MKTIAEKTCTAQWLLLWLAVGTNALLNPNVVVPRASSLSMVLRDAPPPDFSVIGDDEEEEAAPKKRSVIRPTRPKNVAKKTMSPQKIKSIIRPTEQPRKKNPTVSGTSWMDKNRAFTNEESTSSSFAKERGSDFEGTRVFVKGIPSDASWQDLKDHFKLAGTVVFASVSIDPVTGRSKNVGLVQFETNEEAKNAIKIMRNHPLNGSVLYVRQDVQEYTRSSNHNSPTGRPPNTWECADDDNSSVLSNNERQEVLTLIQARDQARRKRDYPSSDRMREELKQRFGVHLDDRLKKWWVSLDGSNVPQSIQTLKGEGRWGKQAEWRQIPTTPENDLCVNPDLVMGLLKQRDIARKEKDFRTADELLEQARTSPDGDLYLRIHDESRTWRIWTTEKPPRPQEEYTGNSRMTAAEECIELIRERAPHKEAEIQTLLQKFPDRANAILKKLQDGLG